MLGKQMLYRPTLPPATSPYHLAPRRAPLAAQAIRARPHTRRVTKTASRS